MKKTMKSIMLFAAAAMAFSGCAQKEMTEPVLPEGGFSYTFELGEVQTKAVLGQSAVAYEAGDKLGVFAAANAQVEGAVDVAVTPVTVGFTSATALAAGDKLYAYYPYSSANASAAYTAVTMTIPAAQNQSGATYDADAMPMAAVPYTVAAPVAAEGNASVGKLYMNNLAAVAEFNVYSAAAAGEKIQWVSFESETAVAGNFTFDLSSVAEDMPDALTLTGLAGKTVTVAVNSTVSVGASKDAAAKIYMVLAPGQHKGTVKVKTSSAVYTFPVETALAFKRAHVKPLGLNLATATKTDAVKLLWAYGTQSGDTALGRPQGNVPAIDNSGNVYVMTNGYNGVLKIKNDGTKAWAVSADFGGTCQFSPSIEPDGSVVYVGGGKDASPFVRALDAADGSTKWTFEASQFFNNGNTPKPNLQRRVIPAVTDKSIIVGNGGSTGTVVTIDKKTGKRLSYIGNNTGTAGPGGGLNVGVGVTKKGYAFWSASYGAYAASVSEMENPTRTHDKEGGWAPWVVGYRANGISGFDSVCDGIAALTLDGEDHFAYYIYEGSDLYISCVKAEGTALSPGQVSTSKCTYKIAGAKKQDQGGLIIGPQNEIIVALKHVAAVPGGVYAVNPVTGNLAWKYEIGADVGGAPAVDNNGYVHIMSDNGYYHVVKPNYTTGGVEVLYKEDMTTILKQNPAYASTPRVGSWSSVMIGTDGKIYAYIPVYAANNSDRYGVVMCLSYAPCTAPGKTPWPMKAADALHTGCQK